MLLSDVQTGPHLFTNSVTPAECPSLSCNWLLLACRALKCMPHHLLLRLLACIHPHRPHSSNLESAISTPMSVIVNGQQFILHEAVTMLAWLELENEAVCSLSTGQRGCLYRTQSMLGQGPCCIDDNADSMLQLVLSEHWQGLPEDCSRLSRSRTSFRRLRTQMYEAGRAYSRRWETKSQDRAGRRASSVSAARTSSP